MRFFVAHATALAVVVLALGASATSSLCRFSPSPGLEYDLNFLTISGAYAVQDANAASKNFTYFFNVCADTGAYPSTATTESATCYATTGADQRTTTGPAPAWQLYNEGDQCVRLGDSAANAILALEDPFDETRGVMMTYMGGDACQLDDGTFVNRSLRLHFLCDVGSNIFRNEPVDETSTCMYEVFLKSTFGCPIQCFGGDLEMCSGNGVCGYDSDLSMARCFCYPGNEGEFCSEVTPEDDSGFNGTDAALLVASILLVVVLAVLGYLWVQIKSLRLDPSAYESLGDGPGDNAAPSRRPPVAMTHAQPAPAVGASANALDDDDEAVAL